MASVVLSDQQWQQVLGLLSEAPWRIANPLLMEIGNQLRVQTTPQSPQQDQMKGASTGDGASKEVHHGE